MTNEDILHTLRTRLQHDYKEDALGHAIHHIIATTIGPYEGKKLTKRFTDKLTAAIKAAKLFPSDPTCYYDHPGKLHLWHHPTIPYDQRMIFYIAHDDYVPSDKGYHGHWVGESHLKGFLYSDQCHGEAARLRNEERAQLLDGTARLDCIAGKVLEVRRAWEDLRSCLAHLDCGINYTAEELTGLRRG